MLKKQEISFFDFSLKKVQVSFYQPHWITKALYFQTMQRISRPKALARQACYSEKSGNLPRKNIRRTQASRKKSPTAPNNCYGAVQWKPITAVIKNIITIRMIVSLRKQATTTKAPLVQPANYRTDKRWHSDAKSNTCIANFHNHSFRIKCSWGTSLGSNKAIK